ncbi:uncharacterized protein LOC136071598 [Quercus suber]|uniref:uncharacterized protein LOC136071598 n=1 Tax=Quercus suber TaxID=58331 RepID=UPI0032DE43AA
MSLEEDFKYNPSSKESEKKQGPFNSQHGKGQEHKKGFFKNSGNRGQSSRHSKNAYPQSGDKKSCSRCGKLHDGQNCDGSRFVLFVSNSDTLQEIAQVLRAWVPLPHLKLQRVMTMDAQAMDTVVAGILPLFSAHAKVLFDLGSTRSFVSCAFAKNHDKSPKLLDFELLVSTPVGDTLMTNVVLKSCIICIEGKELLADLVLLDMHDSDVILGMDWLASYHASVHCFEKEVVSRPRGESEFLFKASCLPFMSRVISCIQANRLLRKGCQGFLASVVDLQSGELEIGDISIVREFSDVGTCLQDDSLQDVMVQFARYQFARFRYDNLQDDSLLYGMI